MPRQEGSAYHHEQEGQPQKLSAFEAINQFHGKLQEDWAEGKNPPATTLQGLIDYALARSSEITHIEDRHDLYPILRLWGSRLARNYNQEFPDIDIDRADRKPTQITTRPLPDPTREVRRHN